MGDFTFIIDKGDWNYLKSIVSGLDEIDGNQVILNSLSKGMQLINNQGKANLAVSNKTKTGNLKQSIRRRQVKKKMSVYGGFGKGGNHAHLVDRGTKDRYTKKGYYRGSVSRRKPNHGTLFWTKAVESKGPLMMEKTLKVIYKEMDKIIRRNKRKK